MSGSVKPSDKSQMPQSAVPVREERTNKLAECTHDATLSLQESAGNRAVGGLIESSGRALDANTRQEMEKRFGAEFADVRIHSGEAASDTALAAGARAITRGRDIVFAPGYYDPASTDGKRLLAHELTHVIQQSRKGGGDSAAATESEARTAGADVAAGDSAAVTTSAGGGGAQCDEMSEEEKRRKRTEAMLPPGVLDNLRAQGIAPPAAQPPPKLDPVDILAPGLRPNLAKMGIGSPAPQTKAAPAAPKAAASPTFLQQPKPKEKEESLEEMEFRLFGPFNFQARENLTKMIEALGGPSLQAEKFSREELWAKYQKLKEKKFPKPVAGPELRKGKRGGITLAEMERQERLRWENLDRFEHEPGAWIATPSMVMGTPDEQSAFLDAAQTVTGFAATAGAIGAGRAAFRDVTTSPENQPPRPTAAQHAEREDLPSASAPAGAKEVPRAAAPAPEPVKPGNDVEAPATPAPAPPTAKQSSIPQGRSSLPYQMPPGKPANDVTEREASAQVIPFPRAQEQAQADQGVTAKAAGQDFSGRPVASAGGPPAKAPPQLPAGPQPPPQLAPGGKTTLTHEQLRNYRPPKGTKSGRAQNYQGTAGKEHVAELVGGSAAEKEEMTSLGPRRQDVRDEPSSTGTIMRREVKTFREWLTITRQDGTKVPQRNLVRPTKQIREEIAKDVDYMSKPGPNGERRVVQWDFTVSGPDDELRELLTKSRIPFTEVHDWGQ